MSEGKKLISLKEAAQVSGYSADYIGQLIRAGKIPGKQVYCNVAWMTTEDAVLNYKEQSENKNKPKSEFGNYLITKKRKLMMDLSVIRMFFSTFKAALPITVIFFAILIILNIFIVYIINQNSGVTKEANKTEEPLSY